MKDVKNFFKSKTILAALAVLISSLFGVDLNESDVSLLKTNIEEIVGIVGSLIAIYGRVTATAKIG